MERCIGSFQQSRKSLKVAKHPTIWHLQSKCYHMSTLWICKALSAIYLFSYSQNLNVRQSTQISLHLRSNSTESLLRIFITKIHVIIYQHYWHSVDHHLHSKHYDFHHYHRHKSHHYHQLIIIISIIITVVITITFTCDWEEIRGPNLDRNRHFSEQMLKSETQIIVTLRRCLHYAQHSLSM